MVVMVVAPFPYQIGVGSMDQMVRQGSVILMYLVICCTRRTLPVDLEASFGEESWIKREKKSPLSLYNPSPNGMDDPKGLRLLNKNRTCSRNDVDHKNGPL